MVVLMAAFGFGVLVTLMMPISSSESVAEPASALQAGVFTSADAAGDQR